MLLCGDIHIGKRMNIDKFVQVHPNICNQFGEVGARKLVRLQIPSKPNGGRLSAQIIDGLGHKAPYTRRGTDLEILILAGDEKRLKNTQAARAPKARAVALRPSPSRARRRR